MHPTHGQGLASCVHSALVAGLGISSIGSTTAPQLLVEEELFGGGADAAVEIAASNDRAAATTPPSVCDAFTGGLVVGAPVTEIVARDDGALEDVRGALEAGELGASVLDLDADLAECDGWPRSVTHLS